MCQYCGCQAVPAIALLTAEHDRAGTLAGQILRDLDRADLDAAAAGARHLGALLGPHVTVEESGLLPALAPEFPEHVHRLAAEHRTIAEPLLQAEQFAATGGSGDPSWPARLRAALALLGEHILAEQDGVFPAALSHLGTQDWARMDAIRDEVGTALTEVRA